LCTVLDPRADYLCSIRPPSFARLGSPVLNSVGKTALRQCYLGQAFHEGYKATIGCDYVVKALELDRQSIDGQSAAAAGPTNPADVGRPSPLPSPTDAVSVRLAVWDTAGQERYASLSTAFFRGADAVVFVYDARSRRSLTALSRWWAVFGERCPVRPGEERSFPVAVVGNKADLIHLVDGGKEYHDDDDEGGPVSEAEARAYWETLLPPPPLVTEMRPPPVPLGPPADLSSAGDTADRERPSSTIAAPTGSAPPTDSISVSSAPPPVKPLPGANGSILSGAHHANEAAYQEPTEAFASAVRSALADRPPIGPPPPSSGGLAAPFPSTVARGGFHLPPAASSASLASYKTARSSLTVVGSSTSGGGGPSSSLPRSTMMIDEHSLPGTSSDGPGSASYSGWSAHGQSDGFDDDNEDANLGGHRPVHERSSSLVSSSSRLSVGTAMSTETGSSETTVRPRPARDRPASLHEGDDRQGGSAAVRSPIRGDDAGLPPPTADHFAAQHQLPPAGQDDGPAFFPSVSAKTGQGVSAIFEHLARAVYERREREAAEEKGQAAWAAAAAAREGGGTVNVGAEGARGKVRRACGC
jgi:hypothetical protein